MKSPTSICVTGAGGFVGSRLCKEAIRRGFDVIGTYRSKKPTFEHPSMRWVHVNDLASEPIENFSYLKDCSALFHLSARAHQPADPDSQKEAALYDKDNVLTTQNLLEASVFYKVPRFVYLSSVKASCEETKTPLLDCEQDAPEDFYGISKKKAEDSIIHSLSDKEKNKTTSYTILRSPLVYGPFVKDNFYKLIKLIDSPFPLPFLKVKNKRSYVYIDNLIDALLTTAFHEKAKNKSYYVTDEMSLSIEDLSSLIAGSLHKKPFLFSLPLPFLKLIFSLLGMKSFFRKIFASLEISNERLFEDTGWKPIKSTNIAIKETIDWYRTEAS